LSDIFRVLVIDDDPGIREYLDALLGRHGYEVFLTGSGEEALETLGHTRPDLVTLDVVLDGMDGLETLRRLKKRLPEIPVVMLSGHGQARTIVEAMQLGASDFLRKPFEVEELELAFQKALENRALRQEVEELRGQAGKSAHRLVLSDEDQKMREVSDVIEQVADTDITVLIRGESGTGKEMVARTLHEKSDRRDRPFVKVNCAALPSELLESELFGFEKGAFTGAQKRKLGKFEYANSGTIFLDEIGEMSPPLQAKLLQVLQDGEFSRLGGESDVQVDTRILAATNRNLEEAVQTQEFREDLYYRLRVIAFHLPPLRERPEDVLEMTRVFLLRHGQGRARSIDKEALDWLQSRRWPGNARELENAIQRAIAWTEGRELRLEHFDIDGEAAESQDASALFQIARSGMTLKELDAAYVRCVVEQCQGNKTKAATQLGISRSRLYRHLENEALPDQPLPREGARVGLRSGDRAKLHSNSR